ncbi:MAG: hypothetical protein LUH36_04050, partial [Oscillospiraceae bacterium]|nr:hypothetical protein [Oscillospiraceae bacterium]
ITTKESSTNYYSSSVSCFSSDNTSYVVCTNSSRYLELGTAIALTADMLTVNTDDETYTGSPITKSITSNLTEDTDYTVTYANNTNAGTATITITGKGSYTGELIYTFIINKADPAYTVPSGLTAIYGQTLDSVALPNGWAWKDAGTTSVGSVGTNTFSAIYTPDDTANYNVVTTDLTVTVSAIELTKDMFTVDTDDETYTGSAIAKSITSSLVEDTDYTVTYESNTIVGTATITITGKGSYAGELIYKFIINKADQDIALESSAVTKTYGDAPFTNTVTGAVTGQFGYSSWKPEVATVDDNGVVTIVGAGTTNIAVFAWGRFQL